LVTPGRAAGLGIFAAPGVIGLAVGGVLAASGATPLWPGVGLLLALALVVATVPTHSTAAPPAAQGHAREPLFEAHDWIMMLLLAAIALRSAVWTSLQSIYDGEPSLLLWLAFAAAIGKATGGYLADWFGWRRWSLTALMAAALLLSIGGQHLFSLCAGVALLQSATPAMVAAVTQSMPRMPATAAGLTFGLAIAAGGLPALAGWPPQIHAPPLLALLLLASALLYWRASLRAVAMQAKSIAEVS
jgi:FSR family fosmidomycin resistance protein-like MFS transporter